jgi:hypothetical protein
VASEGSGGIITFTDTENGFISQITMNGNAVIRGNTAQMGGGIYLQDQLILRDKPRIIENTATDAGGGVWAATRAKYFQVAMEPDAAIENNTASDHNFAFD